LISNEPGLGERLEVHAMNAIGERVYEQEFGHPRIASPEIIRRFMAEAAAAVADLKFSLSFLLTAWEKLVDGWQLQTWESYRVIKRLGRKTRLQESQQGKVWGVLDMVRVRLRAEGFIAHPEMFTRLASELRSRKHPSFEFVVVDEAQDLSVAQLKFLFALGGMIVKMHLSLLLATIR
jgi:hypothetical protein